MRELIFSMVRGAGLDALAKVFGCSRKTFQIFFERFVTREECSSCCLEKILFS